MDTQAWCIRVRCPGIDIPSPQFQSRRRISIQAELRITAEVCATPANEQHPGERGRASTARIDESNSHDAMGVPRANISVRTRESQYEQTRADRQLPIRTLALTMTMATETIGGDLLHLLLAEIAKSGERKYL